MINYRYHMVSFFGNDWSKSAQELENLLKNQEYGKLLDTLYALSGSKRVFEWAKNHEHENHVPLLYFMVREMHLQRFSNYDEKTLTMALYWAFKSLIISLIHVSEYSEFNKRFDLVEILSIKFQEKFGPYINQSVFAEALLETDRYFSNLLENEYNQLVKAQPIKSFPSPDWIYMCNRGGWRQPALNCLEPVSQEQKISIANKFYRNEAYNFENHKRAFEQGMGNLNAIYDKYRKTGILNLVGGFNDDLS